MGPRRRGWWKGPLLAAAAALAYVIGEGERPADPPGGDGGEPEQVRARTLEVTDGDTIRARLEDGTIESVRYIGVDTPETSPDGPLQCFGPEASRRNERLVGGRELRLRFGPERRDDYGRLLAWVFLPMGSRKPLFVNAALVRGGYARTLTISPNDARAPQLRALEAAAGRAGRGLWAACGG